MKNLTLMTLAAASCSLISLSAGAEEVGVMEFTIHSIAPKGGQVGCALFKGKDGYPMKTEQAYERQYAKIEDGRATCRFEGLPAASYALSVMHDEDGDGELDKNFLGAPAEGWGTSNDAPPRTFGPPSWDDAKIDFDGTTFSQRIRIRY